MYVYAFLRGSILLLAELCGHGSFPESASRMWKVLCDATSKHKQPIGISVFSNFVYVLIFSKK